MILPSLSATAHGPTFLKDASVSNLPTYVEVE